MMNNVNQDIVRYVEGKIIPQYSGFDRAHNVEHAKSVIAESLRLAAHYDVDTNIVYVVAAYHDIGLKNGREVHHIESARMVREDENLRRWFSEDEIRLIADAVEDHRASNTWEPRSIYGRIVAEADRHIEPNEILRRTVEYGADHYPELGKEQHWERFKAHMKEKYADGGYLKLYLPESENAKKLQDLRTIIGEGVFLRKKFEEYYNDVMSRQVRHALIDDVGEIMAMVDFSRRLMRAEGNVQQWVNGYPSEDAIKADIKSGNGYVVEEGDGRIVGYFAFVIGADPTYQNIYCGKWTDEGEVYGTIHRLAKAEGAHNVANRCLEWCKLQIDYLRIDTHKDNKTMKKVASKAGFEYRGIIYVTDGTERDAYQWKSSFIG